MTTTHARPAPRGGPARERRGVPSLAASHGRQGILSRPADHPGKQDLSPPATPRRRGFPGPASGLPGPASGLPELPEAAHRTPAPTRLPVPPPAHRTTPRAIRVRRSPR